MKDRHENDYLGQCERHKVLQPGNSINGKKTQTNKKGRYVLVTIQHINMPNTQHTPTHT